MLVSFLSYKAKIDRFHRKLWLSRIRSIDSNLALVHNKVAYIIGTRELIHLHCTTYARVLGFIKKFLASSITLLHTCVSLMLKCISMQNHGVQELRAYLLKYLDRPKWCLANPHHHFPYQWLKSRPKGRATPEHLMNKVSFSLRIHKNLEFINSTQRPIIYNSLLWISKNLLLMHVSG